ncbi:MAG: thiosulfate oxidation carrier complex protein SoxZ [Gemmatimonadetes bacterium]|nr:thiosulfate oxidation carrier complex protein SoxZ [Gemmatimonadota bacterium]
MPETGKTKIVLPERIQRGDVIRVQVVMQHPMDTGFFRDANAAIIPAWFISDVRVRLGDTEIARFEWTSGISKDPMVAFQLRADQEGILSVESRDNRGSQFRGQAELKFATT